MKASRTMHYYQDKTDPKRIYISPIFIESTRATHLGVFENPNQKMVLSFLFPDQEGYSLEPI